MFPRGSRLGSIAHPTSGSLPHNGSLKNPSTDAVKQGPGPPLKTRIKTGTKEREECAVLGVSRKVGASGSEVGTTPSELAISGPLSPPSRRFSAETPISRESPFLMRTQVATATGIRTARGRGESGERFSPDLHAGTGDFRVQRDLLVVRS